jgi:hypothetical protein
LEEFDVVSLHALIEDANPIGRNPTDEGVVDIIEITLHLGVVEPLHLLITVLNLHW